MKKSIIAVATLLLFVGCAGTPKKEATSKEVAKVEEAKVLTRSAVAQSTTIDMEEGFTSEIKAYKEVDITPAASGVRIDKITVDVGDRVKEGELLVTLDPTQYNQQLISLKTIKNDYERIKSVYEAGGVSRQTLDQAKMNYDVHTEIVEDMKKNIVLTSPISGVVTARNSEEGNLFANQPILHISQIDKLKVLADISEQFFPNVKVGMGVEILLDIYPDMVFEGKVSLIYPALNADSRTFTVEVTVPNKGELLRPGMYARSIFNMGSKPAIMVPDVAVQKQYGSAENYVYVVRDGRAERRVVKAGRKVGDMIDVLSGLESGEEVIVTAFSRMSDGALVDVKN